MSNVRYNAPVVWLLAATFYMLLVGPVL